MPLIKCAGVEDLPPAPVLSPGDPKNLEVALELSGLCYGLRPWRFVPGVHKHRSFIDAQRQQDAWARTGPAER